MPDAPTQDRAIRFSDAAPDTSTRPAAIIPFSDWMPDDLIQRARTTLFSDSVPVLQIRPARIIRSLDSVQVLAIHWVQTMFLSAETPDRTIRQATRIRFSAISPDL